MALLFTLSGGLQHPLKVTTFLGVINVFGATEDFTYHRYEMSEAITKHMMAGNTDFTDDNYKLQRHPTNCIYE